MQSVNPSKNLVKKLRITEDIIKPIGERTRSLCDTCGSKLFRKWGAHHITYQSLRAAAETDCPVCAYIWDTLSTNTKDKLHALPHGPGSPCTSFTGRSQSSVGGSVSRSTTTINVDSRLNMPHIKFEIKAARIYTGGRDPGDLSREPQSSKSTGYYTNLALAATWFRNCTKNHIRCGQPANLKRQWTPTRLLDLQDKIRLVSSSDCEAHLPYMTLSHCWGKPQSHPIRLLGENHERFKQHIPFKKLPKTFQEAVYLCNLVSVRYLWIDSRCIVQDCDSDWLEQADLMGKVYKNSLCNISAAGAIDSTEGCFAPRRQLATIGPHKIGSPDNYWIYQGVPARCELLNAPLNQRAWVVQERLLAPRILHFTKTQLYWECQEQLACEIDQERLPEYQDNRELRIKNMAFDWPPSGSIRYPPSAEVLNRIHSDWVTVVGSCSKCCLSKPTDKLIALSGFASEVNISLRDKYLAGIWLSDIHRQLLWHVDRPGSARPDYRAPSWSWASVDDPVRYQFMDDKYHAKTKWQSHFKILDTPMNEMGKAIEGALHIQGRIFSTQLSWVCVSTVYDPTDLSPDLSIPSGPGVEGGSARTVWLDTALAPYSDSSLFCLPVLSFTTRYRSEEVECLILRQLEEHESGDDIFQRIGYAGCDKGSLAFLTRATTPRGEFA